MLVRMKICGKMGQSEEYRRIISLKSAETPRSRLQSPRMRTQKNVRNVVLVTSIKPGMLAHSVRSATLPSIVQITKTIFDVSSRFHGTKVGQTHFPKSQLLGVCNNVPLVGDRRVSRKRTPLTQVTPSQKFTVFPRGEGPAVPAWVAFEKQALCFLAFWQEHVPELDYESYRVNKVKIIFFLEDDSIQIVNCQPPFNSGLVEGLTHKNLLVRRHRIRMPPPNDDEFYNLEHLKIGRNIEIYGKVFRITGCGDAFTENFLRKMGWRIEKGSQAPPDPGTEHFRKSREAELMPLKPFVKQNKMRKFFDYDRQVLRFFAYWDDTVSLFGDVHELIILYFLADDTIEVREKILPNSGQDSFPVFIRRRKLPKKVEPGISLGMEEDYTILNVLGSPSGHGRYFIQDPIQAGMFKNTHYYTDSDLMIGAVINVLGRKVVLYDCDDFTKNHYRTKFNIEDFTPLTAEFMKCKQSSPKCQREIPPHNGFGSEEDSLANVFSLVPKMPVRNFEKFIHVDRNKDESNILRFSAEFVNRSPLNQGRKFVINFFLNDDSIFVYEVPQRNSGFSGGKFIIRTKIKKPVAQNPPYGAIFSEFYRAEDFHIGGVVKLNKFEFVILDADEYCLKYMEDHPEQFPQANLSLIFKKVKSIVKDNIHDLKESFAKHDGRGTGKVELTVFRAVLITAFGKLLSEHELLTLGRHFSKTDAKDLFTLPCLAAVAQKELQRQGYEDFDKLHTLYKHFDMARTGVLDRQDLYRATRSFPLPIPPELIKMIVDRLEPVEDSKVPYVNMIKLLDFKRYPTNYPLPPFVVFDSIRQDLQTPRQYGMIPYNEFIYDLERTET